MGKDIKEKYERVCAIKDKALSLVETQLNGDLSQVDAKELGEVADIAKDMAEVMKLMEETCYYHKVTEAMEESSEEEKKYYMGKYIPEYEGKFYTPVVEDFARRRDSRGRYMYTEPKMHMADDRYDENMRNRMYYSNNYSYPDHHMNDGRSWESRRGYMEAKEHGKESSKELEKYLQDMADDITEMISGMSAADKTILKQKLATMASKIS